MLQPFDKGTLGSECYRIPALWTLSDGRLAAVADMRYKEGLDSPNKIDTLFAVLEDKKWDYTILNRFYDYPTGVREEGSASFIDSAILQSKQGTIFVITDAFPSGLGTWQAKKNSGCITVHGERKLAIYKDGETFYIDNGNIMSLDEKDTGFRVDTDFNLYEGDTPLFSKQKITGIDVPMNIFYNDALFQLYPTCYLWLRKSNDGGRTWDAPEILNMQLKNDNESFFGVCPGRGFVWNDRIIFPVYDNATGTEYTSCIYSDDNGNSWKRGKRADGLDPEMGKSSESQLIQMPDGRIRMFTRSTCPKIFYADSTDGGETWSRFRYSGLSGTPNCMVSFINYGENRVAASLGGNTKQRADGVVFIGTISDDRIIWTRKYELPRSFFAYSCLSVYRNELLLLYEYEWYAMKLVKIE